MVVSIDPYSPLQRIVSPRSGIISIAVLVAGISLPVSSHKIHQKGHSLQYALAAVESNGTVERNGIALSKAATGRFKIKVKCILAPDGGYMTKDLTINGDTIEALCELLRTSCAGFDCRNPDHRDDFLENKYEFDSIEILQGGVGGKTTIDRLDEDGESCFASCFEVVKNAKLDEFLKSGESEIQLKLDKCDGPCWGFGDENDDDSS